MNIADYFKTLVNILSIIANSAVKSTSSTVDFTIDRPENINIPLWKSIASSIKDELSTLHSKALQLDIKNQSLCIKANNEDGLFVSQCKNIMKKILFTKPSVDWDFQRINNNECPDYTLSMPSFSWLPRVLRELLPRHPLHKKIVFDNNKWIVPIFPDESFLNEKVFFESLGIEVKPFPAIMTKRLLSDSDDKNVMSLLNISDDKKFLDNLENVILEHQINCNHIKLAVIFNQYSKIIRGEFNLQQFNIPDQNTWLVSHFSALKYGDLQVNQSLITLVRMLSKNDQMISDTDLAKTLQSFNNLNKYLKGKACELEITYIHKLISLNFPLKLSTLLHTSNIGEAKPTLKLSINNSCLKLINKLNQISDTGLKSDSLEKIESNSLILSAIKLAEKNNMITHLSYYSKMICEQEIPEQKQTFSNEDTIKFESHYISYSHLGDTYNLLKTWSKHKEFISDFKKHLTKSVGKKDLFLNVALLYANFIKLHKHSLDIAERLFSMERLQDAYKVIQQTLNSYGNNNLANFLSTISLNNKSHLVNQSHLANVTNQVVAQSLTTFPDLGDVFSKIVTKKPTLPKDLSELSSNQLKLESKLNQFKQLSIENCFKSLNTEHCKQLSFQVELIDNYLKITCDHTKTDAFKTAMRHANISFKCEKNVLLIDNMVLIQPKQLFDCMSKETKKPQQNLQIKSYNQHTDVTEFRNTDSQLLSNIFSYADTMKVVQPKKSKPIKNNKKPSTLNSNNANHKPIDFEVHFANNQTYVSSKKEKQNIVALSDNHHHTIGTYFAMIDPALTINDDLLHQFDQTLRNRGTNSGHIVGPKNQKGLKFYNMPNGKLAFKLKIGKNTFLTGDCGKPTKYIYDGLEQTAYLIVFNKLSTHEKESRKQASAYNNNNDSFQTRPT